MISTSFRKMATHTLDVRRVTRTGNAFGAPQMIAVGIACTPLDQVDSELLQRETTLAPHETLQTYVDTDLDIRGGDTAIIDGKEYPIKFVEEWGMRQAPTGSFRRIIVEDVKDVRP